MCYMFFNKASAKAELNDQKLVKRGLVDVAGFFAFFCFFVEPQNFINNFHVGEKHTSTTIPFQP